MDFSGWSTSLHPDLEPGRKEHDEGNHVTSSLLLSLKYVVGNFSVERKETNPTVKLMLTLTCIVPRLSVQIFCTLE